MNTWAEHPALRAEHYACRTELLRTDEI